jgi:Brp/Blh family beta-carotene 15,15'-monooxygenase
MGILGGGLIHRAVNKSLFERLSIGKAKKNLDIFTKFLLILKILLSLFALLSIYFYLKIERFKNYFFKELFYLVVFSIIFKVSTLIWGFALYFIFWHSIPSMMDQITFLFGKVSFNNFKLYFRSAFVYWIVSLLGIALLYLIFKDQKIFNALFFSFLASITFPHVVVIVKMFGKK